MKKAFVCALGCLMLFAGCMELEEKITIKKNGSGSYEAKQAFSKELTAMIQQGMQGGSGSTDFLTSEDQLRENFKGKGMKIIRSSFDTVDGKLVGEYRIEFENAADFFNTPGMVKRFRFFKDGEELVLESISKSASQAGAPQFTSSPETASSEQPEGMEGLAEGMKGMQEAMQESMKVMFKGLKIDITVELPNDVLDSNATRVKGRVAKWTIDENTFSDMQKMQALGDTLWARCSMEGLGFTPAPQESVLHASLPKPKGETLQAQPVQDPPASFERPAPEPIVQPPELVELGGKSVIILKNGNEISVQGYYREGDMLTLRRYGGTISLPVSSIEGVKTMERR